MKNKQRIYLVIMTLIFAGFPCRTDAGISKPGDSTWFVCNDGAFVINLCEHRTGVTDRQTDIALIYLNRFFLGVLDEESNKVKLFENGNRSSYFTGTVKLDADSESLKLEGILKLGKDRVKMNRNLTCKEFDTGIDEKDFLE